MKFRWVIAVGLWTLLGGPILAPPIPSPATRSQPVVSPTPHRPAAPSRKRGQEQAEKVPEPYQDTFF